MSKENRSRESAPYTRQEANQEARQDANQEANQAATDRSDPKRADESSLDLLSKEFARDFAQDLGKGLLDEGKTWLKWAGSGAVIGAVGGAVAGGVLFGSSAILTSAAVCAGVGAVLAWLLYALLSGAF